MNKSCRAGLHPGGVEEKKLDAGRGVRRRELRLHRASRASPPTKKTVCTLHETDSAAPFSSLLAAIVAGAGRPGARAPRREKPEINSHFASSDPDVRALWKKGFCERRGTGEVYRKRNEYSPSTKGVRRGLAGRRRRRTGNGLFTMFFAGVAV